MCSKNGHEHEVVRDKLMPASALHIGCPLEQQVAATGERTIAVGKRRERLAGRRAPKFPFSHFYKQREEASKVF